MSRVMVVDDEAPMRAALEAHFSRDGWDVTTACGANDALAKFRHAPCPLVVTDMRMPDGDGLRVMRGLREMAPQVGIVFLTAFGSVPEAVRALHEAACDYLVKPVSFETLKEVAQRIIARTGGSTASDTAGGTASDDAKECKFVGESPALANLLSRARQVARTDMDVLVEAESGTGKELLARLIHRASGRRNRPFVAVNCAAFPEALLESELFGHARGAFTGASAAKPGKFELAHTGTLLLDEIGEMPLQLQPKLLRTLQEREVDRLGDTHPVRVDVRVIATTNRSLRALVEEGKFRADLYYRLNVIPLSIPPLRTRRKDVLVLAEHFLRKHATAGRGEAPKLSAELLDRLELHDWPGNARELENLMRRAVALHSGETLGGDFFSDQDPHLSDPHFPAAHVDDRHFNDSHFNRGREIHSQPTDAPAAASGTSLREMQRKLLESTLEAAGGNRTHAARLLGICPRTMRNKIREYGLPPRRTS